MMSFFDPALTIDGRPYKSYMYEKVLKEELLIAYLSKGSTSVSEIDEMPINDRRILLSTLRQADDERKKKIAERQERLKAERFYGKNKK